MAPLTDDSPIGETPHTLDVVRVEEDVGALRRKVAKLAAFCPGVREGDVALVATELGTNLVRHSSSGGYVLSRRVAGGVELIAVDQGPGMGRRDLAPLLRTDELSVVGPANRSGGLGLGLGVVANTAEELDLYTAQPEGTVVLARLRSGPFRSGWCRWAAVTLPIDGESQSGDRSAVRESGDLLAALVVDGLGHGPAAAQAAEAALTALESEDGAPVERLVRQAHEAMRCTRGGVLAACLIDPRHDELRYAGVGNIMGRLIGNGTNQNLLGQPGTVGTHLPGGPVHSTGHHWAPGSTLILASDGLRTGWNPAKYPGLLGHDPVVVAAVLQRDYGRLNDDVTVLVVQDLREETR
jgi:anti-sigma regulatory factor (Ser/Thr protein kinase)